jgi:hypothetical protein
MRFAIAVGLVLVSGSLMFAQQKVNTGLSKHANAGRKSASSGSAAITPNTRATADALTKIEQQHVNTQPQTVQRSPATPVVPKTATPAANKNKPIKFSYHPPAARSNPPH